MKIDDKKKDQFEVLPKDYKFPERLPGENLRDYAIRVKVHPSCPVKVVLHPDDIAAADRTEEVIARGWICFPPPAVAARIEELMKTPGVNYEEALRRIAEEDKQARLTKNGVPSDQKKSDGPGIFILKG